MNRRHQPQYFLTVLSFNINSLRGKKGLLTHLLDETDPDVVCLQETLTEHELVLRNYKERQFTAPRNGARGTKLLVKKSITTTPVDCAPWASNGVELTGIDVHLQGETSKRLFNTYIGHKIPYRANRATVNKLYDAVGSAARATAVGDMNAKLDVPQHLCTNNLGDVFDEYIEDEKLSAIMSADYTRYDPAGRAPSTIDFAIVRPENGNMVSTVTVLPDIGSDHRPVLFKIPVDSNPLPPTVTRKPNFRKANWESFKIEALAQLREAPPIIHSKQSLDGAVQYMSELVKKTDVETIPRVRIKHGPKKRELPPYIMDMIYTRRNLVNVKQKKGRVDLNPQIRNLSRIIEDEIETFEFNKYRDEWEDCLQKDRHGFFKLAGRILKPCESPSTYPITDQNGQILTDDHQKLDEFSRLYHGIYSPPLATEQSKARAEKAEEFCRGLAEEFSEVKRRPPSEMLNQTITPEKIRRVLQHTKNTSPGEDGIYYAHLKNLPDPVLVYLAKLYQTCWECNYFPDAWKNAVVTLLPKAGKDHTQPKNYRPISLLSALGKVFERLINNELVAYLEANNILPESQAGFRPKRSTQDQLLKLVQEAKSAQARGHNLMATFFDVEKAFDKMWHQGFLLKLLDKGFDRATLALIQSYLTNRTIQIRINGKTGPKIPLRAGTPQGAILSPTLFNLYVADIPQPSKKDRVRLSQFADDIATWATGRVLTRDNLQRFNNKLIEWCKEWRVVLAPAKTQLITISKKKLANPGAYYQLIDGHRVETSPTAEFLGVTLDSGLSMRSHATKLITNLRKRVGLFRRITGSCVKPVASTDVCKKILHSMIVSQVTYASVVTCLMPKSTCDVIDGLLRKAGRLAIHTPSSTRNEYVTMTAGLTPIKDKLTDLGKRYVTNQVRSSSIKGLVESFKKVPHNKNTPLYTLLND